MSFDGFPKETLAFLDGITRNNEKAWFDAHRDLYEAGYIAPARSFVDALGPRLRSIAPAVQFSTRINGSLSRINRDVRFSKDKRPYKEHLGIWFWHGERRRWDVPGFWFELTPGQVQLGVGLYLMQGEQLDSFRQSVVHPRSARRCSRQLPKRRRGATTKSAARRASCCPAASPPTPTASGISCMKGCTRPSPFR